MDRSSATWTLLLDLGDVFTKGVVVGPEGVRRFRFPSVVSRRLMERGRERTELLLDGERSWPAPVDFEPRRYPRTRSYPGAARVLEEARPVAGARFAGWLAAKYGADRELLGTQPTEHNVEALVRKALLTAGIGRGRVRLVLVVDPAGPKAHAIHRYAESSPHRVEIEVHQLRRNATRRVDVTVACEVLDAAACAAEVLPRRISPANVGWLLVVDVGYLRAKLAVLSPTGCDQQRQLPGHGVSDCVHRLLRDGAEQGLVEDELAVMRALERSKDTIEVADRRFDVGASFEASRLDLEHDLARVVRAALLDHFDRRGEPCRAVAIVGGGAAIAGEGLAATLRDDGLGVDETWVARAPGYLLVEGAIRIQSREGKRAKRKREVSRV